jgi:hypothetical protein
MPEIQPDGCSDKTSRLFVYLLDKNSIQHDLQNSEKR